jgi:Bacterial archaeo-eukaryotic release factor family 2
MLLDLLSPLKAVAPPFASVCIDATRIDAATADEVSLRWAEQARHLRTLGVPAAMVDALAEPAVEPTGRGGEQTRVLVAADDRVVLDLVLPGRPVRDESSFGPVPLLMPVARALSAAMPYAVARVDRSGADLEFVGLLGSAEETEQVDGEHDVVHKAAAGGMSQRRYQARVEDSWDHNADAVAKKLDVLVRRHRPELVMVTGDDKAVAALERNLSHEVSERLVHLNSGGRAAGASQRAERKAIEQALAERQTAVRGSRIETLAEQLRRQQEAVEGLDAVVDALRRGQVSELVLHDQHNSSARLWAGAEPLQIGLTRADAEAAGAVEPAEERAEAVLIWGLVGSSAGVTILEDGDFALRDGIGAVLRWSDRATPHSGAPSMPGHGQSPGMPQNVE